MLALLEATIIAQASSHSVARLVVFAAGVEKHRGGGGVGGVGGVGVIGGVGVVGSGGRARR